MFTNYLEHYTNRIRTLNRGVVGKTRAPHKPLLLLSIIDLIELLKIENNQIPIDEALKTIFEKKLAATHYY